ncbi:hypothetical protein T484DRAFT_1615090, partial [Baffinella frigidus]
LLSWFKHRFFKWVNNEACAACGSTSTANAGAARPNPQEAQYGAGVVELYKCNQCQATTRFPRYNHPGKLLETRKGRCGEWANCFTACCVAMGFEARHVVDWTDHAFVRGSLTAVGGGARQGRWIHMDCCEDCWDVPLLYSGGWNKKLTYCIAFSKEEVVDVTCRYSRQWEQCKARRTKCPELWLAQTIMVFRV